MTTTALPHRFLRALAVVAACATLLAACAAQPPRAIDRGTAEAGRGHGARVREVDGGPRLRRVHVVPRAGHGVLHRPDAAARQGRRRGGLEALLREARAAVRVGAGNRRSARRRRPGAQHGTGAQRRRQADRDVHVRSGGRNLRASGGSCSTRATKSATARRRPERPRAPVAAATSRCHAAAAMRAAGPSAYDENGTPGTLAGGFTTTATGGNRWPRNPQPKASIASPK